MIVRFEGLCAGQVPLAFCAITFVELGTGPKLEKFLKDRDGGCRAC